MRKVFLAGLLWLAACAPSSGAGTPVPASLRPYTTTTPGATPSQPQGLVISFETPLPTPTPFTYKVKSGDTLSQIAENFGIPSDVLQAANPNVDPTSMRIGQILQIPSAPANPSSESTPTPAAFAVDQIGCTATSERGLWCFALARNDSQDFMEKFTAQFSLLDSNGHSIAGQTAVLPLNILAPHTSLPLTAFFPPEVPAGVKPLVQILTAIRLPPGDSRYLPATLQNTLAQIDWPGRSARLSGFVLLPASSAPARVVWVAAVAYDAAGRVAGVRRWESNTGLAAGGSLPFSFMIASVAGGIERVEFAVEARP